MRRPIFSFFGNCPKDLYKCVQMKHVGLHHCQSATKQPHECSNDALVSHVLCLKAISRQHYDLPSPHRRPSSKSPTVAVDSPTHPFSSASTLTSTPKLFSPLLEHSYQVFFALFHESHQSAALFFTHHPHVDTRNLFFVWVWNVEDFVILV